MAQWLVRSAVNDAGEGYEVTSGGERLLGVTVSGGDVGAYRRAALMLRANVIRRLEDPEPVFAVDAADADARHFVEMLNAA